MEWNKEVFPYVWVGGGGFSEMWELLFEAFADSIFKSDIAFFQGDIFMVEAGLGFL